MGKDGQDEEGSVGGERHDYAGQLVGKTVSK